MASHMLKKKVRFRQHSVSGSEILAMESISTKHSVWFTGQARRQLNGEIFLSINCNLKYITTCSVLIFIIPVLVIFYCYYQVFCKLREAAKVRNADL
ncbi:unnamed protein product [Cylicostephanus goldi]|uniref:Uncharacterized protein n=1 Tax=Cylicostephanus goldi TaxID=71465 RepID=A0A3P6RE74_CYLGO|nr:unnamed protein product [Cylicostephanus goldi]